MSSLELIKDFPTLKKNLKKDFSGKPEIKIAIVGDFATQFLNQALKGYGFDLNYNFKIYEADYNQIEAQIMDTSSELYQFVPDFVLIFQSIQKLHKKYIKSHNSTFADKIIQDIDSYCYSINDKLNTQILYVNFPEINDGVFGNFGNKLNHSFIYQLRKINFELMNQSIEKKNLHIIDYSLLNTYYGKNSMFDAKMYYSADMVLSIDALPVLAKNIGDTIATIKGKFKKCLIIDLDNTMWGGIIGDDGIENIQIGDLGIGKAFTELQWWFKQLKQRGIILAICSKNNEHKAKEPFENHPDMVLKLDDIAVFVANWNNKADNIRYIQSVLNIGFDSLVFLDDNPVERSIVRENLPEVVVPELPEDPAFYLDYLLKLNLFETASFAESDEQRTKQYQEEASRTIAKQNFTNEDDFLKSLEMYSEISGFNKFNTPRVAQLSQRSNQFNLRTVRYTEDMIEKLIISNKHMCYSFNLVDKFGDNGLISMVILEKQNENLFIDTWLMSCRVLKRSMENFTLNKIVNEAKKANIKKIIGEYISTSKNEMVKDHYLNLGFTENNGKWELDVSSYQPKKNFIDERAI
jgi:FkbH-like protein